MVFNNPERLNAVNFAMKRSIPGIIEGFDADDEVRVVVVTGQASGRLSLARM